MNPENNFRVVIVGRPNVGKSTLFNRLIGRRRSLVHDMPGVTRDRIEGKADWWFHREKFAMSVIDTGGMGGALFTREIAEQVHTALENADLVFFLMDGQTGLITQDRQLFVELKRSGVFARIPVIGVVNKVDVNSHESRISDFYQLGLDQLVTISAEHARGIDELKHTALEILKERRGDAPASEASPNSLEDEQNESEDEDVSDSMTAVTEEEIQDAEGEEDLDSEKSSPRSTDQNAAYDAALALQLQDEKDEDEIKFKKVPRVAIVGRPNVGKSTLLNAVLGEKRVITSPIAGTTVDSIDTLITRGGREFCLVDTAGIRRKSKTEKGIEVLSVLQAKKALEQADVAILVLDGEEGLSDQDEKIGGMIEDAGCSVILMLNKWDTQEKNQKFTQKLAAERIRKQMAFLRYAPIVFASALENRGLDDLWGLVEEIIDQRKLKVPTHEFTEWVREEITIHNPMNAKFYLCHQAGRNPPTFVCHVSSPDKIHFSLKRHLINAVRSKWGFMGSPIRMLFVEGTGKKVSPRK